MVFRGNNRHTNSDALKVQPISIQMRELSGLLRQRNQSEGKGASWFQGQASAGGSRQSLACFSHFGVGERHCPRDLVPLALAWRRLYDEDGDETSTVTRCRPPHRHGFTGVLTRTLEGGYYVSLILQMRKLKQKEVLWFP